MLVHHVTVVMIVVMFSATIAGAIGRSAVEALAFGAHSPDRIEPLWC
jgi:hypothetical protein